MLSVAYLLYYYFTVCAGQNIVLRDNGYEGILLAISDSVPYNASLIPGITAVFNKASSTLYKATNYRAYFKEITILVPSSWNISTTRAVKETFDRANIRVDLPSPENEGGPWVSQPGGCGEPGDFMHITPSFLLEEAKTQRKWGSAEKVIVHEWGHLRWGLFDEYPKSANISEHFYNSPKTESLEAARCSLKIEGRKVHRITASPCKTDPSTSLPEKDCRFYPSNKQIPGQSSMMYYQFLPEVLYFCDNNESSPETLHNIEAPSRQNRFCNYKSSWEVMRDTVDFAQGANPSRRDPNLNTTVKFKIVKRACEQRIVIVMDVSGSMNDNDYISKMMSAVKYYLNDLVPTDSWVGLVKYSDSAQRITQQLIQITGENVRASLVSMVTVKADGYTAIGSGLLLALEMLKENAASTESSNNVDGYRIILLTDGQENRAPYINDVKPQLIAARVIVDTVLFGPSADEKLQSLAADTGGVSFYSSGSTTSAVLWDSYRKSERQFSCNLLNIPITITSRVVRVNLNTSCFTVPIDKSLGVDTTFTFNWITYASVNITISSPNNMRHSIIVDGKSYRYRNNNSIEVGLWNICLKSTDSSEIFVVIQVESAANGSSVIGIPITVRTAIANQNPSFENETAPVTILATVSKGYTPIINAKVRAYVESPLATSTSMPIEMELRDDGALADIEKDDGIYSGYLLNTATIGKHAVTVTVIGTSETKIRYLTGYSGAPIITVPGDNIDQEPRLSPTDEFERHSLVGFIDVISVADPSVDNYPPSRINDLTVKEASFEAESITFEWSAVGDDLDKGNASRYELWRADSFRTLLVSYLNASKVNDSDIIAGNLSKPLPPYSKERLTIRATDKEKALVYAILAMDDAGNASPISNFVSVKLLAPEIPFQNEELDHTILLVVALAIGLLAFATILVSMIFLVIKHGGFL